MFKLRTVSWNEDKIERFWFYIKDAVPDNILSFGNQAGKHVAHLIYRIIGFNKIRTIVDIGCGNGEVIRDCRKYMTPEHTIIGFDGASNNPDAIESGSVDLVIITEVIEHLSDDDFNSVINGAVRILKEGGYIFITTPYNENLSENTVMCPDCGCVFHRWQHVRSWTISSVTKRFNQHGFDCVVASGIRWHNNYVKRVILNLMCAVGLTKYTGIFYIGRKRGAI